MKLSGCSRSGQVVARGSAVFTMVLVLSLLIAGIFMYLFYFQKSKPAVVEELIIEHEPEVVVPEVKAPEPEPVVIVEEPEPEPEPVVVEPVEEPVVIEKEKTEVDRYLEKKFPMASFAPLEKIVKNWETVSKRAFPEKIEVKVALDYKSNGAKVSKKSGHEAVPLEYSKEEMLVGLVDDAGFVARVNPEGTNFKELVAVLYQGKIAEKEAKVISQREAYRGRAEKEIAKLHLLAERKAQAKQGTVSDFDAKKYGRKFRGDYWPETKNNKNEEYEHEIPLGPIGGVGGVVFGGREVSVISVWDDGPGAKVGLNAEDVIVKVNGRRFDEYSKSSATGGEGAPENLGEAILKAQAEGQPLVLTVIRGEDEVELSIDLPGAPEFTKSFPADCARSEALRNAASEYLVEIQGDDGKWRANDYTTAWAGIALLSTGDDQYAREIKKAARWLSDKYDLGVNPGRKDFISPEQGKGSGSNWFVPTVGMFLAEYYLATGDKQVLRALDHCCKSIEERLTLKSGRLGHNGIDLPYGGKGLVVVNTHAHVMWALAAQINGLDNWNWDPWKLSYKSIEAATGDNGGVGYNFSLRGDGQSANRTGATLTSLVLAERDKAKVRDMSDWLIENNNQYLNVHAMTFIGPIYGFMGLKNSSSTQYRKILDKYQWFFALLQPVNYSQGSYYYGGRGNTGGDEYCNKRICGNIMSLLVLNSHRNDTLWMYGNRKKDWFK